MNLIERTLMMAKAYSGNRTQLCNDSGVNRRWFYLFINEEVKDPSVNLVQRLHDHLANL